MHLASIVGCHDLFIGEDTLVSLLPYFIDHIEHFVFDALFLTEEEPLVGELEHLLVESLQIR